MHVWPTDVRRRARYDCFLETVSMLKRSKDLDEVKVIDHLKEFMVFQYFSSTYSSIN